MNADQETDPSAASGVWGLIRSALPALDPNGQPFSMILLGAAADLGGLRSALSSNPDARRQLLELDLGTNAVGVDDDRFSDVTSEVPAQAGGGGIQTGDSAQGNARQQDRETERIAGDGGKKRSRDDGDDDGIDVEGGESDDDMEDREQLLMFLPSVRCTCSSWEMADVCGDLFVTSLRVLFLPEEQDADGEQSSDVAIDGRCIALHAVDSLPSPDGETDGAQEASQCVYCQLAEPLADEADGGCTSASSMVAPAQIIGDIDSNSNDDDDNQYQEENGEEDGASQEDGIDEVYFKPTTSDEGEPDERGSQSDQCQKIFDSLTRLASLSPAGDADDCGGLFSMLSMMAGIEGAANGFGGEMVVAGHNDDEVDDMVFRLGGSNNLVEDDEESEGAPEGERRAMLDRLDDMLVVPPEYEIASSEDGQFEDAEEDDEVDEIL